jgi:hypothetical protein
VKGTRDMADDQPSIIIEYKNERPMALLDLTASLAAFGQQFERNAPQTTGAIKPELYVREIRSGSTIAELIPLLEGFDAILKHREIVAGFMAQWQETVSAILTLSPKAKEVSKADLRASKAFVQPIANDIGAQMNVVVQEGGVLNQTLYLSSSDAQQIQHNANHLLGDLPTEERFTNEPMVLFQVRDGPPSKAGDRGYIDRFSPSHKKLTFGSEEAKHAILTRPENPFDLIFFVSGIAKTAGGTVAAYHITALESTEPKEVD